jgi:WD40 repeat protein
VQAALAMPDMIWSDSGRGQECTLRGHSGSVTRVQFSDDGLQVISSSNDGTVLVSTILRPNPACQSCVLSLMISFAGLASVLTPLVPPDRCASGM